MAARVDPRVVSEEELAEVLGLLFEEGAEDEMAELLEAYLADFEGMDEEEREETAAEITAWLFEE